MTSDPSFLAIACSWDWKAAENEFKRALEINAKGVEAHV
jgi:hypothetical protein